MHVDSHLLVTEFERLSALERRVIKHFTERKVVARDPNASFDARRTMGDRVADRVAAFGGSWTFIILAFAVLALWLLVNARSVHPFDPYPFILLNLVLSCVAALQAPVIMMSQNRQAVKDRLDAQHDYEVNLKAEMEVMALHLKIDELRDRQWSELVQLQKQQIELLERILATSRHTGA